MKSKNRNSVKTNSTRKAVKQPQKRGEAKRPQLPHPFDIIVGYCLTCLPDAAGERRVVLEALDHITRYNHPQKGEIKRRLKTCDATGSNQAMRDMMAKGDVRSWPDGKVTLEKCLRAPAADEFNQALFDLDDTAEKCGAMLVMLADQLCEHIEEFEPGIPHNRAGGFVLLALDLREELTARHSALFAISRRLGKQAKN